MERKIKRRFSAYPEIKTAEEEKALQAILLQPNYGFGKIPYSAENNSITAEYFLYVDESHREFLVCEVIVNAEKLLECDSKGIREYVEKIYDIGMNIEREKKILPDYIREDKNEEYCLRKLSYSIGGWLEMMNRESAQVVTA